LHSLLSLKNIQKEFPGCVANKSVNLSIEVGKIHALLGENGAGKSTLVKIIYGILMPDKGHIEWNGQRTYIRSPIVARKLGIAMVFQHFSLFDALTVVENIALGIPFGLSLSKLAQKINDISELYGLTIDPHQEVHSLSVGERQRVEIIRCLLQKPKLLIMDEPTSVLTPQEAHKLFKILKRLSVEGCAILYISHRLREIRALCDKATILRQGKVVNECDPSKESARTLAEMMMGSQLTVPKRQDKIKSDHVKFSVKNLSSYSKKSSFGINLQNISFDLRIGEIFGIAGLAGNGQLELMKMLSGEVFCDDPETIKLSGQPIGRLSLSERRQKGLFFIPEERLGHSAVADMPLWENGLLSAMRSQKLLNWGFLNFKKSIEFAECIVSRFNVKVVGVGYNASGLSGGNLQKFIVGREIQQKPNVLIAVQPTWGVDAGSAAAIHKEILSLAEAGSTVLIISQDLDELFLIADRITVISEGRISRAIEVVDASVEEIGLLMGGSNNEEDVEEELIL